MSVKLDIFKIKKIIEKRGGKLLSEIYINNHAKLDVICELGHLWHPTVKSLKRGSWCSTCYNLTENRHKAKHKPEKILEAHNVALEHNGKCLSTNYVNNKTPLIFKCEKGHVWNSTLKPIKRGSWCPECEPHSFTPTKLLLAIKKSQEIAKLRGGLCLTISPKSLKDKFEWQCSIGHKWFATYQNVIYNKSWCPYCNISFSETICRKYLEYIFEKNF